MPTYNVRLALLLRLRKKYQRQRVWVRHVFLMREELGEFRLFMQLHDSDEELFFKYTRMSPQRFDIFLKLVQPYISHSGGPRKSISPCERLAVTLRYLATGDSQQSIGISVPTQI